MRKPPCVLLTCSSWPVCRRFPYTGAWLARYTLGQTRTPTSAVFAIGVREADHEPECAISGATHHKIVRPGRMCTAQLMVRSPVLHRSDRAGVSWLLSSASARIAAPAWPPISEVAPTAETPIRSMMARPRRRQGRSAHSAQTRCAVRAACQEGQPVEVRPRRPSYLRLVQAAPLPRSPSSLGSTERRWYWSPSLSLSSSLPTSCSAWSWRTLASDGQIPRRPHQSPARSSSRHSRSHRSFRAPRPRRGQAPSFRRQHRRRLVRRVRG